MHATVSLPAWAFVLLAALAGWAVLARFLRPAARAVIRRRANRVIDEMNARLPVRLPPFKMTKREVLVDQLRFDPKVLEGAEAFALATYSEAIRLGALQARTGAPQDSGRSLDRAESLFQAASNVEGVTECLYVRARFAGTPAEARELIGKALSAARVTDNDQQQIKLLLLSSNAHLGAGQTAEALDDANSAIAIARAAGIENLASRGLIDLGNALFVKGRTAEAMRTIQEALDIARRNREKRSEARALANLGSIRIQTGDTAQGWQDVQAALAYYRQGSFRTEAAIALILLCRAARDKDDYDGARRAFEETLA